MTQIGEFTRTPDGFRGRIHTLTVHAEICIVAADPGDAENTPNYRLHLGGSDEGPEIGAGWKRTGEKAGAYVSLQIDDPALGRPIHANLFQSSRDGDVHDLVWNRPNRRDDRN